MHSDEPSFTHTNTKWFFLLEEEYCQLTHLAPALSPLTSKIMHLALDRVKYNLMG